MSSSRSRSENHRGPLSDLLDDDEPQRTNTWPLDKAMVPKAPSGSPNFRSPNYRLRNRSVASALRSPVSGHEKRTPRAQHPALSPALRAAALSVANGAGPRGAGFLKGCVQDITPYWSSQSDAKKCLTILPDDDDGTELLEATSTKSPCNQDMIIFAPTSPPSGSERPSRLRQLKRQSFHRRSSVVSLKEEPERCSCCTKDEFWLIYDVFASMNRRKEEDSVSRVDFVWSLSAHGASVDFQRVVRRAGLSAFFKSTARNITLVEFIRRIFPNATGMDVLKMQRWACLRKARKLLMNSEFTASPEEFRQVFSLLEEGSSGIINAIDLLRAQILSRVEILAVLPATVEWDLTLDGFDANVVPVLFNKYGEGANAGVASTSWAESVAEDSLHDEMRRHLQSSRSESSCLTRPDATDEPSLLHAALTKSVFPRETLALMSQSAFPTSEAASPSPNNAVAELVRHLSPPRHRFISDPGPSPMFSGEHSPVVSAF